MKQPPLWTTPSKLSAASLAAGTLLRRGSLSRIGLALAAGALAWRFYTKSRSKPTLSKSVNDSAPVIGLQEESEIPGEFAAESLTPPLVQITEEPPLELASEPTTSESVAQTAETADFVAQAFAKVDAHQALWQADPQMQQFTKKTGPITGRLQPAVEESENISASVFYPKPETEQHEGYTPLELATEPRLPSAPIISTGGHPLLQHVFPTVEQAPPYNPASSPLQPVMQTPSAPLHSAAPAYTELPPLPTPQVAATAPGSRPLVEPFLVIEDESAQMESVSLLFTPPSAAQPVSGPMNYIPPQPAIEGGFLHVPEQPHSPSASPVTPVQPITNALTNLLPQAATPTSSFSDVLASNQPAQQQVKSATTMDIKIRQREPEPVAAVVPGVKTLTVAREDATLVEENQSPANDSAQPAAEPHPDDTPSGPIKKQWLGWWK